VLDKVITFMGVDAGVIYIINEDTLKAGGNRARLP
jgi:hypothetical protein